MTVQVTTDHFGLITEAAPIVKKFKGQYLRRLIEWMDKIGPVEVKEL